VIKMDGSGHTPQTMDLAEIYRLQFRFVWRTLRRFGVSEEDAPDAVQEVFIVVHRRLAEFEGRAKLTTWLFSICMNVARSRRRNERRQRRFLDRVLSFATKENEMPVDRVAQRERALLLGGLLEQLPEGQRAVFILFELEELTGEAIAAQLEIPLGTVQSRLRLARATFREASSRIEAKEGALSWA
jgi:RNA polymerase sigma-70 factor (ECF subfamily)